jgi:hypothetical protein
MIKSKPLMHLPGAPDRCEYRQAAGATGKPQLLSIRIARWVSVVVWRLVVRTGSTVPANPAHLGQALLQCHKPAILADSAEKRWDRRFCFQQKTRRGGLRRILRNCRSCCGSLIAALQYCRGITVSIHNALKRVIASRTCKDLQLVTKIVIGMRTSSR